MRVALEPLEIEPGDRHAPRQVLVIGMRRGHEAHAVRAQPLHRRYDVVGGERDVLDAFAVIGLEVLLDLGLAVGRLVDRDADLAAGAFQRARLETGLLPVDVEVADLAETEQALVEARPVVHAPLVHVVGEVIDTEESRAPVRHRAPGRHEIDVVDRALAVAVDEVDQAPADAADRGNVELHRSHAPAIGPRPERERPLEGAPRVLHAQRERARRRAVHLRERLREARPARDRG